MTQSARPVFHPVAPRTDVSDEQLARFATSKGVGTLVTPAAPTPAAAPQITQEAPKEVVRTTPSAPSPRKASRANKSAPATKPRSGDMKLSVQVPRYVGRALKIRAAHEDTTVRRLVLQGLHTIGIAIEEADLNDDNGRAVDPEQPR